MSVGAWLRRKIGGLFPDPAPVPPPSKDELERFVAGTRAALGGHVGAVVVTMPRETATALWTADEIEELERDGHLRSEGRYVRYRPDASEQRP